ncbi:COG4223 family protein [Agrobacterium sp. 22094]|uniref:COG4223 family protein n=1 Tax=Agrobacterium sp. 22094 TaxID=3453872 RepID=UPI003F86BBD8
MVSGKPPRHSKSKTEPVTIDLDAKDVTDVSATKPSTSADTTATSASSDAKPVTEPSTPEPVTPSTSVADGTKAENPKPIWDQPTKSPIEPEPNVGKPRDASGKDEGPAKTDATVKQEPPKATAAAASTTTSSAASSSAADSAKATSSTFGKDAPKSDPFKPQTTSSTSSASSASKPSAATTSTSRDAKPQGNSGLIAAGIVGGLIALLAAGSMQYAGVLPSSSTDSGSSTELAALKSQVASLQQQIAEAPKGQTADTSALEQRLAALESSTASGGDASAKISQLETTVSTLQSERAAEDQKIASLTQRLDAAETKINEPRDDVEVARAIASAALKAAIDRGGPLLTELDTLSKVTPDDPAIQSLRPFANTGVPTRAELVRRFPDVANAMLAALRPTDPNEGIIDRLANSAMSLVKVRPVGNVEGEGDDAKIARMEDKLQNGDLKGAALEWDALPEAAKTASADYKKSLDARIQVEDLVNSTLNRAVSSTGQQG